MALQLQFPARLWEAATRKGDRVSFTRADVFLPGPEELFPVASGEALEGVVIGFSDSGARVRVFAVVEVVRKQEVVVPVHKLRVIGQEQEE